MPGDFPPVHRAPCVSDVSHHERDKQGYPEHDQQREIAGGAVPDGQGALQVDVGGVIGRIVETGQEEDPHDHQDGAGGGEPKKILRKNGTPVKDLLMSMPSDLFMGGDSQNNRRAHGIKTVINVVSGAEYHVTTPPDFSLAVNFDKLDRMVADYDIDPASYTKMKENIIAKNMVAKNILACIKNEEKTSLDGIYETVRSSSVEVSSGTDEFVFDLVQEYQTMLPQ